LRDGEPVGQLRLLERREGDRELRRKRGRARARAGRTQVQAALPGRTPGHTGEPSGMSALEQRLAAGGEVRLAKREAQDVLQKLRARGAGSENADRIERQLAKSDEVVLAPDEAGAVLEELRAS